MIVDDSLGHQVIQDDFDFSSSGNNTIVSGVSGKNIKVLQIFFVNAIATIIKFRSGSTDISGAMSFTANGSMFMDYIKLPLQCLEGDSFIINSTAAAQVGGTIWYMQTNP